MEKIKTIIKSASAKVTSVAKAAIANQRVRYVVIFIVGAYVGFLLS